MASTVPMEAPICLVENSNGELIVNQQGLQILTSITKPVVVVAIVGMYRTGKSYLMNKLAGKNKGFSLGSTVQSHTKGIWMWCVPHPIKSDHTLVLLDTEGLGDVEKGDSKNDSWIFALAILLSSTFVYNSMNTINHQALEQMQYVKELTELIKVKSSPNVVGEDSAEFVGFFPDFVWTVRDFTLELELDGRPITPDEYLENALKLSKGEHPKIHMANLPRECIRKFFPKRKCFTFDRPTNNRSILAHLEDVQESQLEPAFKDQAENFCSYIFSNAKPKTLSGGIMVNGNRLGKLLETYVKTISRGDIPCLENAVLALAQTENSAAVQKATNHYVEQMKLRVDFPTETLQDLLNLHTDCEKEAISIFMKHSFKDDTNKFKKELVADEVLQKFLQSLAMTEEAILQTDQALTEQEKALEVEQVKREAAEKEKKLLEQQQMEMQQKMEAQQRSYEENIKQLKQKMEEDRKQILKEQEAILDHKLKVTMASTVPMEAPICLVENSNGELIVNQQGLQILTSITKPVVVVAIVGMYRTGKSYLMNKLAGKNKGFSLGSTVQSHTKGIWMWCVPHPIKFDHTLVLLDTEGLRDVEKGDSKNDSWIFALAILLSSTFIYNSMNTINHQALEQMQYVTELTELIKVKSSPNVVGEDSAEFVGFFPDFVWTVRDFTLELKLNGLPITPDEYLENALKLSKGNHRKIQMANLPRECIRKFFPKRKCFTFDRPTNNKSILAHLEDVQESQLEPAFKDQAENFCSYIFSNAKPKTLSGGIMVNGNRLGKLLETYVKTISRGDIPCLENAVLALAQTENSAAVQKATNHYVEQMKLRVDFPTETLQDLLNLHTDCEKEAISIFMKHSFKDDTNKFKKELVENLESKKDDFICQNEEESTKYCQSKLENLSQTLILAISQGTYSVPGGYQLYRKEREKIMNDYHQLPRKGVKADEVLQKFLQSLAMTEEAILQTDQALTEQEKALEVEQVKREAAEKEKKLLEQQQMEMQQKMEAQQRSYEENIKQLKQKMEEDRKQILKEQEAILDHKLKEQKRLMEEGFHAKAKEMEKQMKDLQEKFDAENNKSQFSSFLDHFSNVLMIVLPGAGKLLGLAMKLLSKAVP
ncbi:guanylate-binding protein 3-like isoform X3 [Notamacropus eugenii]|uniref:guanylate-binding protein 3-like isoform X3 n=1 Tax=Notamacropus eugenii TaxID=9315 RepID=UPI003B67D6D1